MEMNALPVQGKIQQKNFHEGVSLWSHGLFSLLLNYNIPANMQ